MDQTLEPKKERWSEWRSRFGNWRAWVLAPEWALRWIAATLASSALFKVLDLLGKLAIVVGVTTWWLERNDRLEAKHNQAWTLIMTARGAAADGGRKAAIEGLIRDRVRLNGIPLSSAQLIEVNFSTASLWGADFEKSTLNDVDFSYSRIGGNASFKGAKIDGALFDDASITESDFTDAKISNASFQRTFLSKVNFANDFSMKELLEAKLCNITMPDGNVKNSGCE